MQDHHYQPDFTDSYAWQDNQATSSKADYSNRLHQLIHEAEQPLTVISAFAELGQQVEEIPEEIRNDLSVIVEEARKLQKIIRAISHLAVQLEKQG